jgi:hypothetical protein
MRRAQASLQVGVVTWPTWRRAALAANGVIILVFVAGWAGLGPSRMPVADVLVGLGIVQALLIFGR